MLPCAIGHLTSYPESKALFDIEAGQQAFQHFRILQTGPNSTDNHRLTLSGFEVYGELFQ